MRTRDVGSRYTQGDLVRFGWKAAVCVGLLLACAASVYADVQNVQVGAELRIRGRYYKNVLERNIPGQGAAWGRYYRIPGFFLDRRPIGVCGTGTGNNGISSGFAWDDKGPDWKVFETALQLNVKADLSDGVSAFTELYDFHTWGEDFRSNWITGADSRAVTADDVEINQAYIDMNDLGDQPLRLRVGRQALKFGKGWLVNEMLTPTQRVSFDAIRLTYTPKDWSIDAFAAKVFESGVAEEDGDANFYGVYGTYSGFKPVSLSAYWFWLRDARSIENTTFVEPIEWIEDAFDLDDYDVTNLHTVGIRANGAYANFDYDLELAYQFGNADQMGYRFVPYDELYGDQDAEWDNLGAEFTLGYTFVDVPWKPRPFVMFVYYEGEDNRSVNFRQWANPFDRPEASVSFNRLFSDKNYMPTVFDNGWLSNYIQYSLGVEAKPLNNVTLHFHVAKDLVDEPFNPPAHVTIGDWNIPLAGRLSFWDEKGSDDIGWETALWVKYDYSPDLSILLYWNHLFTGDGLSDGAFIQYNGTDFTGGTDSDDADYWFWMTVLKF